MDSEWKGRVEEETDLREEGGKVLENGGREWTLEWKEGEDLRVEKRERT